ncbi:DNA transposase THAP9 [Lepeophtheirus salmonis]|uniref:THAP-type domain-containing protein n=2 Tax=Lepeophtheirus salmonis TaxID=72036 RepID=A0A0K2UCS4_LEPSM|nr:THAP domain-containing protein 1-like [Lepeophtheirus salmonis]
MPTCVAYKCKSRTPYFSKSSKGKQKANHEDHKHSLSNHGDCNEEQETIQKVDNETRKKSEERPIKENICFFAFPKRPELRKRWLLNCRRKNWTPSKWSKLCSKHFKESDIIKHKVRYHLVDGAIPTIFNFPKHLIKVDSSRRVLKRCVPEEVSKEVQVLDDEKSDQEQEPNIIHRDHSYALPNTLDLLAKMNERARLDIITLVEEKEILLKRIQGLSKQRKTLNQKCRRLQKQLKTAKDKCQHLKQKRVILE